MLESKGNRLTESRIASTGWRMRVPRIRFTWLLHEYPVAKTSSLHCLSRNGPQDCSKIVLDAPTFLASCPYVPDMPQHPKLSIEAVKPTRLNTDAHMSALAAVLVFSVQCRARRTDCERSGGSPSGSTCKSHSCSRRTWGAVAMPGTLVYSGRYTRVTAGSQPPTPTPRPDSYISKVALRTATLLKVDRKPWTCSGLPFGRNGATKTLYPRRAASSTHRSARGVSK